MSRRNVQGQSRLVQPPALCALFYACVVIVCGVCAARTVRTLSGSLRGVVITSHHQAAEVFRGVPYAAPPQRFSPPLPPAPWFGVRNSAKFAAACPQWIPNISNETDALKRMPRGTLEFLKRARFLMGNQSEDCLYLNIYTPLHASSSSKYSVVVWVHGEDHAWGSGHLLDGATLASHGQLIVVTLGYRLGLLGFINTGLGDKPMVTLGLQDLTAAFQWVQDNIKFFGGDPGTVTAAGHGSGAVCVHWLAASVTGKLFQRVALLSGSAVGVGSVARNSTLVTQELARHTFCPEDRLLDCLRGRPIEMLLSFPMVFPDSYFSSNFAPSVDGKFTLNDKHFYNGKFRLRRTSSYQFPHIDKDITTLRHKKVPKYDLLLGATKAEAFSYFSEEDVLFGIETEKKIHILQSFINQMFRYHQPEILATLVTEYTGWERAVQHPANILQETLEALSDGRVVAPLVLTADAHYGDCFFYVFGHQARGGNYPQRHGCVHGEELPFLFGVPLVGGSAIFPYNFTKTEVMLSRHFMTYFSNFVTTGNPNKARSLRSSNSNVDTSKRHKKSTPTAWPAYDRVQKRYILLDTKCKVKDHYRAHQLSFWLNLVPQLHRAGDNVPTHHHQLGMYPHR